MAKRKLPIKKNSKKKKPASYRAKSSMLAVAPVTTPVKVKKKIIVDIGNGVEMPVESGRSSVPEGLATLGGLFGELAMIEPDFPIQLLEVMEYLAKWNADFSYAVDNIVQLGNTEWEIEFEDSIPDDMQIEMVKRIKARQKTWYAHAGGLNSLINDLFVQATVTGAISAEMIPSNELDGIERVVIVSPKHIRFRYDVGVDRYVPCQLLPLAGSFGNLMTTGGLKPLNEVTYKYIASRRLGEKPYAVPPFLAALENIIIEKDMMCNLKSVVKKLGLLGFLEVLVNVPTRLPNEPDNPTGNIKYYARCEAYLQTVVAEVDKGTAKGYLVGYKGTHEFKMQPTNTNVTGAEQLFKLNTEMKMAGFKQDPMMLGRNYNSSETLGRVMITKLSSQVGNHQSLVASFLEPVFFMDLFLAGYPITTLSVKFKKPILNDEMVDQQAEGQKIKNVYNKYNFGMIDIDQAAQELGYESADQLEPRGQLDTGQPPIDESKAGTKMPKTTSQKKRVNSNDITDLMINELEVELDADLPEFPYRADELCGCTHDHTLSFDNDRTKKLNEFVKKYLADTGVVYSKANKKIAKLIAEELSKLGESASLQMVTDAVIYHLYKNWKAAFTAPQKKVIEKWVREGYNFFRKDKAPFGPVTAGVPEASFSLTDYRTIQYFRNIDTLYLGKFITDADTKKAIVDFIKKEYLEKGMPIGNNIAMMEKFRDKFANVLDLEDWKLQRIINTTVNKMRNYAAVNYMQQAEVASFSIAGVNDSRQCGYCASLQGKSFSVVLAVEKVEDVINSDGDHIKQVAPFITSVYKTPDLMKDLSAQELQKAGIDLPPFHPSCRDIIVADL